MKITLQITLRNADQVAITDLSVLQSLVPDQMDGEALNWGQGEGQLRVEDTVWGFYINDAKDYSYTLEEGVVSLEQASAIAIGILERIRIRWGQEIESELRGCHHDDPSMRMVT